MKRFRFPLASVLTLRDWREREARERFGAAAREVQRVEAAVQQARARATEIESVICAGRRTTFRPAEQAAALGAYEQQRVEVKRAEQLLADAKRALDGARQGWQTARSERRAIGQLETRAREAHRVAMERAEQAALDDLASLRATRPTSLTS